MEMFLGYLGYFGWLVAGLAIGFFIKEYFPSYMKEKGKNLATKEDIEEITKKIESVKSDFQKKHIRSQFFIEKQVKHYEKIDSILMEVINGYVSSDPKKNIRNMSAFKKAFDDNDPDSISNQLIDANENSQLYISKEVDRAVVRTIRMIIDHSEARFKNIQEQEASLKSFVKFVHSLRQQMRKELLDE